MPIKNPKQVLLRVPVEGRVHTKGVLVGLVRRVRVVATLADVSITDCVARARQSNRLRALRGHKALLVVLCSERSCKQAHMAGFRVQLAISKSYELTLHASKDCEHWLGIVAITFKRWVNV